MAKPSASTILDNIARLAPEDAERVRGWREAVGDERFVEIVAALAGSARGAPSLLERRMPLLRAMAALRHDNPTWKLHRVAIKVANTPLARELMKGPHFDVDAARKWLTRYWNQVGVALLKEHRESLRRPTAKPHTSVADAMGIFRRFSPDHPYERFVQRQLQMDRMRDAVFKHMSGGVSASQMERLLKHSNFGITFSLMQRMKESGLIPPLPPFPVQSSD